MVEMASMRMMLTTVVTATLRSATSRSARIDNQFRDSGPNQRFNTTESGHSAPLSSQVSSTLTPRSELELFKSQEDSGSSLTDHRASIST